MINWFLSVLVSKEVLSLEDAEVLAKKLATTTYPQDFTECHKIVTKILEDIESSKDLQL